MSKPTAKVFRIQRRSPSESGAWDGAIDLPRSGRSVSLHEVPEGDRLVFTAPDGSCELSITLTREGPRLRLSSAALELVSTGDVTVTCDRFVVDAQSQVTIRSGGDLEQHARGEATLEAGIGLHAEAPSVSVAATLGNVDVRANDDVTLEGERIFLNR